MLQDDKDTFSLCIFWQLNLLEPAYTFGRRMNTARFPGARITAHLRVQRKKTSAIWTVRQPLNCTLPVVAVKSSPGTGDLLPLNLYLS